MMKILAIVCCLVLCQYANAEYTRQKGTKESCVDGCPNLPVVGSLKLGSTGYDNQNCLKYVCAVDEGTSYEYTIESCPQYSGKTVSGTDGANYPDCCPQPVGENTGVN